MKTPKPERVDLDNLVEERRIPLRRAPTKSDVTVMAQLLQREDVQVPLVGFADGELIKIVDGRVRLQALKRLDDENSLPLPAGTTRKAIPVYVLDPHGAYGLAARANTRNRPLTSAERVRHAQVLARDPFYKLFVENRGMGRPPSQTRAIANLFDLTTEGARLIRRVAEQVQASAVCQVMNTSSDRDSALKRIAQAVRRGTDPQEAVAATLNATGADRRAARETGAERLDPETLAAQIPLDTRDYIQHFAAALRPRFDGPGRDAFVRILQGRQRPDQPRGGDLVPPQTVDRVRRRILWVLQRPDLKMTHGAIADLAHCGEASISEIVNVTGRKRQHLIEDVDAALNYFNVPHDPPDPRDVS